MNNRKVLINRLLPATLMVGMSCFFSSGAVAGDSICRDAGLTGKGFGLCTAYCEAMDCGGENPNANETACNEVQTKFLAETGLSSLPCGDGSGEPPVPDLTCPCDFDAEEIRAAISDQLTYPYLACNRQKYMRSVGTTDGVLLASSDQPELSQSSKYVYVATSSNDSLVSIGGFNCAAVKIDIDAYSGPGRPFGSVDFYHSYLGERLPLQASLYQSCIELFDALVLDVFPNLECSDTTFFEITIVKVPDEYYGCVPYTVQFQITEIFGGEPPYSALWDFGDGNTSTELNPTHTYTEPSGTPEDPDFFDVTVTLTDVNGYIGHAGTEVAVAPPGSLDCPPDD